MLGKSKQFHLINEPLLLGSADSSRGPNVLLLVSFFESSALAYDSDAESLCALWRNLFIALHLGRLGCSRRIPPKLAAQPYWLRLAGQV